MSMQRSSNTECRELRTDGFTNFFAKSSQHTAKLVYNSTVEADSAQGVGGFLSLEHAASHSSPGPDTNQRTKPDGGARCLVSPNTIDDEVFFKYASADSLATLCYSEWLTALALFKECSHLPYFMRPFGIMKNKAVVEIKYPEDERAPKKTRFFDPFANVSRRGGRMQFSTSGRAPITRVVDVGVFESLRGCKSAASSIVHSGDEVIASFTYQLSMAVLMAQRTVNFAHNDLHWGNVFVARCDPNLQILFQYQTRDGALIRRIIPTHGVIPVVIDYGFSYSKALEGHHPEVLYADNHGYITYEMDDSVDVIHTLNEYSTYSKTDLAAEIGATLRDAGIKRGRDSHSARALRPSWEDVERKLLCAAFWAQVIITKRHYGGRDPFVYAAFDAIYSFGDRTPLMYDTRCRDLVLHGVFKETVTNGLSSFANVPPRVLEDALRTEVESLCADPAFSSSTRKELIVMILRSTSKAVRQNTVSGNFPILCEGSAGLGPVVAATDEDEEEDRVAMMRLKHAAASSAALSTIYSNINSLITKVRGETSRPFRALHAKLNKVYAERLVSLTFALAALRSNAINTRSDVLVANIKRGIKLPLRQYHTQHVHSNTVDSYKTLCLKFLEKWSVWVSWDRDSVCGEAVQVVERFLADSVRQNTASNGAIDMSQTRADLLSGVQKELTLFVEGNEDRFGINPRAVASRVTSFEVDWYEIVSAFSGLVATAGSSLDTSATRLRNFRRTHMRAKIGGSGEALFLKFEQRLYEQTRLYRERRSMDTPVLVIDDVNKTGRLSTISGLQKKKRKLSPHGRAPIKHRETTAATTKSEVADLSVAVLHSAKNE